MTKFAHKALLAGAIAVGLGAAAASAQTLGEELASGQLSAPAFEQLIAHTGLSEGEARDMTLEEVVAIKWQDD
jgi:hypothetical protein